MYEIAPRAREGLPLPPTETTNQLLTGILARTQRDDKVTLCNFVDMNGHSHQLLLPKCPHKLTKFYMEYQKKVTDTVRKLTKLDRLELWENRLSVIRVAELEDAIKRVVYIFLNPARAGLVSSIDEYPGLSSWNAFKTCEASVDAAVAIPAYWTPASKLDPLPEGNRLSPANDRQMARDLRENEGTIAYDLMIHPLAWLEIYGVTDPVQIEEIRQRIIRTVYAEEAAIAKQRREEQRPVIGAERLKRQKYLMPHTPKEKRRRIFVICGNKKVRQILINSDKAIAQKHRECYQLSKHGLPHEWPPGTFIPWLPPKQFHPKYEIPIV